MNNTSVKKEFNNFYRIFSKDEIQEAFDILVKHKYLIHIGDDKYVYNEAKIKEIEMLIDQQ